MRARPFPFAFASVRCALYPAALLACLPVGCANSTENPSASVDLAALAKDVRRDDDKRVIELTFRLNAVDDSKLAAIADFSHLRKLTIQECRGVTSAGLEPVGKLAQLRELHLIHTSVDDDGLRSLKSLTRLRAFSLQHSRVNGAGLKHLASLPLHTLRLAGDSLTAKGLAALPEFRGLTELHLNANRAALRDLPSLTPLKDLTSLNLRRLRVDDASLDRIAGLPKLRSVDFDGQLISDAGLLHFARLPALRSLNLAETRVSDNGLKSLRALDNLNKLVLSANVTDAGLEPLSLLRGLNVLDASTAKVTGRDLPRLAKLTALRSVHLFQPHVNAAGMAGLRKFKQLRPDCKVQVHSPGGQVREY